MSRVCGKKSVSRKWPSIRSRSHLVFILCMVFHPLVASGISSVPTVIPKPGERRSHSSSLMQLTLTLSLTLSFSAISFIQPKNCHLIRQLTKNSYWLEKYTIYLQQSNFLSLRRMQCYVCTLSGICMQNYVYMYTYWYTTAFRRHTQISLLTVSSTYACVYVCMYVCLYVCIWLLLKDTPIPLFTLHIAYICAITRKYIHAHIHASAHTISLNVLLQFAK